LGLGIVPLLDFT